MTISNKLFLVTALAIGMNTFTYDVVGLKSEATKALNFAQTLEQQPTTTTNTKVAQWLKKGLANENYSSSFNNETVIEIARIIDNNTTIEAKITALLTVLADQEAAALKSAKKDIKYAHKFAQGNFKAGLISGACGLTLAMMFATLISQEVKYSIWRHDNALLRKVEDMIANATTAAAPTRFSW